MNKEKSSTIRSFTDLIAWQKAHALVLFVYKVTRRFPREEMWGLTSQVRRSAVSISANIAEGFSRHFVREKIQFWYISRSSLAETQNHLLIAHDLGYIENDLFKKLYEDSLELSKIIQGLIGVFKSSK